MINKKNIILIGMPGTGKTTISQIISKILNMPLVDMDLYFEKNLGISIKEFFSNFGEKKFREKETQFLKEALKNKGTIISTGGGVVLDYENRILIKNYGWVYFLKANLENIKYRIGNDKTRINKPNLDISKIFYQRKNLYNFADHIISTDNLSVMEISNKIIEKITNEKSWNN